MGYVRRSPVFSFVGVDRTPRKVTLVNDEADRPAQIGKRRPRRLVGTTVSLLASEFDAEWMQFF